MKWIFGASFFSTITWIIWAQDIVFSLEEGVIRNKTITNRNEEKTVDRIPVSKPEKCPENMVPYETGENAKSWICDCRHKFVYFPDKNECHEIYKQGPCPLKYMVVFPLGEFKPKCSENPCPGINEIPFNGACAQLGKIGGQCGSEEILSVNETTLQIECTSVDLTDIRIIDASIIPCPRGSQRNLMGSCKCDLKLMKCKK